MLRLIRRRVEAHARHDIYTRDVPGSSSGFFQATSPSIPSTSSLQNLKWFRLWGKRYMEIIYYLKPSLYISNRLSHRNTNEFLRLLLPPRVCMILNNLLPYPSLPSPQLPLPLVAPPGSSTRTCPLLIRRHSSLAAPSTGVARGGDRGLSLRAVALLFLEGSRLLELCEYVGRLLSLSSWVGA